MHNVRRGELQSVQHLIRGTAGFGDLAYIHLRQRVCTAMQGERISHRRANASPVVIFYREYLAVIFLGQFQYSHIIKGK